MNSKYLVYNFRMVLILIVLSATINNAFSFIGYDLFKFINTLIINYFSANISLEKKIYLISGICAIVLSLDYTLWLPFLGDAALPSSLVPLLPIKGNTSLAVKVAPNTKVAYWAASPSTSDKIPPVAEAYNKYDNAGVVVSDDNGIAILVFDKGTAYKVPYGKTIQSHVHYRELSSTNGMIGPVKTKYV